MRSPATDLGTARTTLAAGAVVVAVFALLAAISGAWSPLARRPLLDSGGPVAAYRWVNPPPELASTNKEPTSTEVSIRLLTQGSEPSVPFTSDNQATLFMAKGAVAGAPGDTSVTVSIEPRKPPAVSALPGSLVPFGNVYLVTATGSPSGHAVQEFDQQVDATLVYPVTVNLHSNDYELLWSADGTSWTRLKSQQSQLQQQVEARIPGPGRLLVAAVPSSPAPSPTPASGGGANTVSIILLVVAGASLLIGIALLIRARRLE